MITGRNFLADIFRNQLVKVATETTSFRFLEQFCELKYISRYSLLGYNAMQSDMYVPALEGICCLHFRVNHDEGGSRFL
jgi:hypothetical protein